MSVEEGRACGQFYLGCTSRDGGSEICGRHTVRAVRRIDATADVGPCCAIRMFRVSVWCDCERAGGGSGAARSLRPHIPTPGQSLRRVFMLLWPLRSHKHVAMSSVWKVAGPFDIVSGSIGRYVFK